MTTDDKDRPGIEPAGCVATIAIGVAGEPLAVAIRGLGPWPDWLRMVVDSVERRSKAPWTTAPGPVVTVEGFGIVARADDVSPAPDTWRDRPSLL